MAAADCSKSFCKVESHETQEIVFACYECSDTYCFGCLDAHKSHTLIYFKDAYLVNNFEHVQTVTKVDPKQQPPNPVAMDVYKAKCRNSRERVLIKVLKDFKQKPSEFKHCVLQ